MMPPAAPPDTSSIWTAGLYILAALFLVLLNGFFVLVEFALVKIRRTRLVELVEEGKPRAELALRMHQRMDEYLSATQLGITVASLGLGWIGEPAFARLFDHLLKLPGLWADAVSTSASLIFSFTLITFLHILIGELTPKSLAIQQAERSILWSARLMHLFYILFYVPLITLTKASNAILRLVGMVPRKDTETVVTEEELRHVLAHSHDEGEFSLDRLLLFENTLDLTGQTTGQIMMPISEVDLIDVSRPWAENFTLIRDRRHSRFPMIDGDPLNIIGMLHVKDLGLRAMERVEEMDPRELRRDVFTIRDSLPLERLLREFQRKRQHLAVVQNRKGVTVGMVTLEDLLEELVGEIVDEFDVGTNDSPLSLAEYINPRRISLELKAETVSDTVREVLEMFRDVPGFKQQSAVDAVMKRERDAPTGLGREVAVPHGRLAGITRPYVAFVRSEKGIDFKSSDGLPCKIIFLMLTPQSKPDLQVKLLSRIAGMVQSEYLISHLEGAETPEEVMEIIRAADLATTL